MFIHISHCVVQQPHVDLGSHSSWNVLSQKRTHTQYERKLTKWKLLCCLCECVSCIYCFFLCCLFGKKCHSMIHFTWKCYLPWLCNILLCVVLYRIRLKLQQYFFRYPLCTKWKLIWHVSVCGTCSFFVCLCVVIENKI